MTMRIILDRGGGRCSRLRFVRLARLFAVLLMLGSIRIDSAAASQNPDLLARDNLIPWELPWDQVKPEIEPDTRARMLKEKGFRRYALMYSPDKSAEFDAQIRALVRHGVETTAVYLWLETERPAEDPNVIAAFESFKRLRIRPQIWVSQSTAFLPKTLEGWKQKLAEAGFAAPAGYDLLEVVRSSFSSSSQVTEQRKEEYFKAYHRVYSDRENLPRTVKDQVRRLDRETSRIASLARLASRYGLDVALYNHNGWFGIMDNQLGIIEGLEQEGIKNVGIVYTFWHARDDLHDDVKNFERIWARIRPHVLTVAISGIRGEMESLYPSEGEDEISMLSVVRNSGWKGPVGVLCLDNEVHPETALQNVLLGTEWLSAELRTPGSGGRRPIFRNIGSSQK